jgi:hypothetical protein
MAPPSATTFADIPANIADLKAQAKAELQTQETAYPSPIPYSGTLDAYESFDVTPIIGREFPNVQLSEILNDDAKVRDLAVLGTFE